MCRFRSSQEEQATHSYGSFRASETAVLRLCGHCGVCERRRVYARLAARRKQLSPSWGMGFVEFAERLRVCGSWEWKG